MSFRNTLWISGVVMAGLVVPASAETAEPMSNTTATTYTRTYLFPATGYGPSENIRITVVNIAPASHNGTKASCNGSISFNDATGKAIPIIVDSTGKVVPSPLMFSLGTGQITTADLPNASSNPNKHMEVQGVVQLTLSLASQAPCSPFLTLEIYDPATGVTHAVVTTVTEQSASDPSSGLGR